MQNRFEKSLLLDFPVEKVFEFHKRQGALERLSPQWQKVNVIRQDGGINPGATVKMALYDPFKIIWNARHIGYQENSFFSDIQESGPFASWKHNHILESLGDSKSLMKDQIEFTLPLQNFIWPLKYLVFKKLNQVFFYRHKILKRDLYVNSRYHKKKTILVSGGSGVLGSILIPKLTTAGHTVRTLVRRLPRNSNEFYWNPARGITDIRAFDSTDVVINLSGESIGNGWWTKRKKERILKSRTDTASLISKTISNLKNPPELFISSSATGYYGDNEKEAADESSPKGSLFISNICHQWEKAAYIEKSDKTRTILLRTGVVLTPLGGALPIILKGLYSGTAGVPGTGNQYVSWISSEDWLSMVYEIIFNDNISGPVNACAPSPLPFKELLRDISKATGLPAYLKIPEVLIRLFTGQRGYETVLCGTRAVPDKMMNNNFKFFHNRPIEGLKEMLGREVHDEAC